MTESERTEHGLASYRDTYYRTCENVLNRNINNDARAFPVVPCVHNCKGGDTTLLTWVQSETAFMCQICLTMQRPARTHVESPMTAIKIAYDAAQKAYKCRPRSNRWSP